MVTRTSNPPLQSVFGYISVLPGAFSAYRYKALQNGPDGKGPLASYFKGEAMHSGTNDAGLFGAFSRYSVSAKGTEVAKSERNMYLAEDRILCFEIVTKKREGWVYVKIICIILGCSRPPRLRYVKSAKAATDVPTTVSNIPFSYITAQP